MIHVPGFVFTPEMLQNAQKIETLQRREVRKGRRSRLLWMTGTVFFGGTTLLLAGALNYLTPLKQIVPVFYYTQPDGVMRTAITLDQLPLQLADATVKSTLWQYVAARESYSWVDAKWNYTIADILSVGEVKRAYEAFADGHNPNSYLVKLGKNGIVRVGMTNDTPINFTRPANGQPGHITYHFYRQVTIDGVAQRVETWSVSLAYIIDYTPAIQLKDVLSFDPAYVFVVGYDNPVKLTPNNGNALE